MRTRMVAFLGVLALAGVAAASVNFSQTFTNRTGAAAGGFNWWFTPDSASSNVGSSVFTSNVTTHHNPVGTHGYTTTAEIHYSVGNVNVGASASMWATLANNSTVSYRPEWTNTSGVRIGSANLPVSLGGSYHVSLANDRYWTVRIDNPSDDTIMLIDNLRTTTATAQLIGPGLGGYAGPWATMGSFSVPPLAELSFDVSVSEPNEFLVVDCDLSYNLVPGSESELQFQVTPEPVTLALLFGGAAPLLLKRRRKKQ